MVMNEEKIKMVSLIALRAKCLAKDTQWEIGDTSNSLGVMLRHHL